MLRLLSRILLCTVVLAAAAFGGLLATQRVAAAAPPLTAALTVAGGRWSAAPGPLVPIAVPAQGSLAVEAADGRRVTLLASSQADIVRPIASVAKTMTALVIVEVHPLLPAQPGPILTVTQQDVDDYRSIAAAGGSFAPVSLGERLSERDLLLGLMLPSANNLALTAARWIDGSVTAFVSRLNARAAALGMSHTHFADPDGLSAETTSTAADLLLLAAASVADDALVSVVSTTSATLPDGTVVTNLDRLLGAEPGWLGIKTGWTPAAAGCLLFAARRTLAPGAPPLTVVGAVLGQAPVAAADADHPELGGAFTVARAAVDTAFGSYTVVRVGPTTIPVSGSIHSPWGTGSALHVAGEDRVLLLFGGDALSVVAFAAPVTAPRGAGAAAGSVTVSQGGSAIGVWTLVTDGALAAPSAWWKLLHG